MSEEIVNSAYSFSDISEYLEILEEEKNGKFIKTWKINTNNIESEIQIEEKDQEDSQIAISEEYETYGTERKKRLVKRTFYNKDNPTKIEYYEVFEPSKLEGNYVSKLLQPENSLELGYRCYKNY